MGEGKKIVYIETGPHTQQKLLIHIEFVCSEYNLYGENWKSFPPITDYAFAKYRIPNKQKQNTMCISKQLIKNEWKKNKKEKFIDIKTISIYPWRHFMNIRSSVMKVQHEDR